MRGENKPTRTGWRRIHLDSVDNNFIYEIKPITSLHDPWSIDQVERNATWICNMGTNLNFAAISSYLALSYVFF